jgi:hypothetical protein
MQPIQHVEVDIIIPVHNASKTIEDTVESAMHQEIPQSIASSFPYTISVTVCCYDDASIDDSLNILERLQKRYRSFESQQQQQHKEEEKEVVSVHAERQVEGTFNDQGTQNYTLDSIKSTIIPSRLLVCSSCDGKGRGAGYARNRAIEMNNPSSLEPINATGIKYLCFLDSDDIMHKHRVAEQSHHLLSIQNEETRARTLLGCTFVRDPPDSTWHYSDWANNLSDERLMLERFREITVLQPTWFMPYSVWANVGGYIEAPPQLPQESEGSVHEYVKELNNRHTGFVHLIHLKYDTLETLRLAEDLRFYHSHLQLGGTLSLHRSNIPLVTYRHAVDSTSQSFRTSRILLLRLRVMAFQTSVLCLDSKWHNQYEGKFVIWGAGRDGKDFFKALDDDVQKRVYCFVDVDSKKLNAGYYIHRQQVDESGDDRSNRNDRGAVNKPLNVPIIHFSYLIIDRSLRETVQNEFNEGGIDANSVTGRIDKSRQGFMGESIKAPPMKKQKQSRHLQGQSNLQLRGLSQDLLERLPVVVCVAMYRTNGVLERNVASIGRAEGDDLWHFS